MPKLIDLFGENQLTGRDLISSSPKNLTDMGVSGTVGVSGAVYALELTNRVVPKVDYSNFKNFVFFNSALDYFNITGDRMIAEYPYDGTYDDLLAFRSASDPYENYMIDAWPRWSGSGYFSGSTYIVVGDNASNSGYSALMALSDNSTGTLSVPLTLEYRILFPVSSSFPATGTAAVICQHFNASGSAPMYTDPNYTVYLSTSGTTGVVGFHLSGANFGGGTNRVEYEIPNAAVSGVGYYMAWVMTPPTGTASGTLQLYKTNSGSSNFPFTDAFQFDTNTFIPLVYSWNFTTGTSVYNSGSNTLVLGAHPSSSMGWATNASSNFQLTEVRYWTMARDSADIYLTYNNRIYRGDPLRLYWRFAEPYITPGPKGSYNTYVKDYSGYGLNGVLYRAPGQGVAYPDVNPFWIAANTRTGGIGMVQDNGEPLLSPRSVDVQSYVRVQQASGFAYDRNNQNIITNLVPQQYLHIEDEQNTAVMKNLLYLLGRQFDELKTQIDQTVHILTADYGEFNTTPDALLDEALKFWGWSTKGNFLNKEAFQWFFGLDVIDRTTADIKQGVYANERLEVELYQIKNEFWRRVLNNLSYLYKTKGTRESVEALFRIYGLDQSVVKLKEYGIKPFVKIETNRINSIKSHDVIRIDANSGNYGVATKYQSILVKSVPNGSMYTIDMQIAFPAYGSTAMPPIVASGSEHAIFHIMQETGGGLAQTMAFPLGSSVGGSPNFEHFTYTREWQSGTLTNMGSLMFENSNMQMVMFDNLPIFDGRWYHMVFQRYGSEYRLDIQFNDTDRQGSKPLDNSPISEAIPYVTSGTLASTMNAGNLDFMLGYSPFPLEHGAGQFWAHNVQVWNTTVTDTEIADRTINPFSHGSELPEKQNNLEVLWQFDKLIDSDNNCYFDSCDEDNDEPGYLIGSGSVGTASWNDNTEAWSASIYDRFNFSYNYIAPPDYGWTEEKIRYLDTPRPDPRDHWAEINDVGIEFNLIDALNEDISMMMSTMDNWNNIIGDPANRYRENYPQLEKLRQQYFARMSGRINFRVFIDYLDFFDRSFIELVKKLLPARIDFQGAEVVVESHMLERNKVQYNYRRQNPQLVPEGVLTIYALPEIRLKECKINVFVSGSWNYLPQTNTWVSSTVVPNSVEKIFAADVVFYNTDSTGSREVVWSLGNPGQPGTTQSPIGFIVPLEGSGSLISGTYSTTGAFSCSYNSLAVGAGYDTLYAVAKHDSRVYVAIPLTVVSSNLEAITVSPANPSISTSGTQQFTATGHYHVYPAGALDLDITTECAWLSSVPGYATVNPGTGYASGVAAGATTIYAVSGTITGSTTLTVVAAEAPVLMGLFLTPVNPTASG